MDKFEALEKAMCKELEELEQQVANGGKMSTSDLDQIDKLVHAMKSLATYKAMKEAEEYEGEGFSGEGGYSGRRGRAANGRFVSREGGGSGNSYADGYSQGYSAAMSQQQSGHWPMMPRDPYRY